MFFFIKTTNIFNEKTSKYGSTPVTITLQIFEDKFFYVTLKKKRKVFIT